MLITISGLPGAGTSTVARRVAGELGLEHLDGGTVFRAMASERGLGVGEFSQLAERDDVIDRQLDDRLAARARGGDVVLESRLAGWIATKERLDALRVWIDCEPGERARRVAQRDQLDERAAGHANEVREASEAKRYLDYYGIDIAERSIYDLDLDSTSTSPDALVDAILSAARAR